MTAPIIRASAAMVELRRPGGTVAARWCSCWPVPDAITWDGEEWTPRQFSWSALDSHASAGAQASLTMALLPSTWQLLRVAEREQWTAFLQILQFDESDGETGPPADAVVIASYLGLVRGSAVAFTPPTITWRLGIDDGGVFPPMVATTYRVGTPCVL
jgi:hypothetical protein